MTKRKSTHQTRHNQAHEQQTSYCSYNVGSTPYTTSLPYGVNNVIANLQPQFGSQPYLPSNLGLTWDIFEQGEYLIIEIPFPSLVQESLEIIQNSRWIRIQGRTENPGENTGRGPQHPERRLLFAQIPRGFFDQVITLPYDILPDQTQARFHNGILQIQLLKAMAVQANRVPVSFK